MDNFIQQYQPQIKGSLSGWDRIVFRGCIRTLAFALGMAKYLQRIGCLLKNFGEHAQAMTEQLIVRSLQRAEQCRRPVEYIASPSLRKEEHVRAIAKSDGVTEGLVAVLTCVEPCRSFEIFRNKNEKKLEIVTRSRKCKFLYHYEIHPVFGLMYTRIQTWFPFNIQIGMNGREYLARQMDKHDMAYTRSGNCFPDIENLVKAQGLMNAMHKIDWPKTLDQLRRRAHPAHESMFAGLGFHYYWSAFQTEWATDVMFDSTRNLQAIYPSLVRGAMESFDCREVMRFLGRKQLNRFPEGEVTSDYGERYEGIRIKHVSQKNSVKAYDKAGSILRIETTINNVRPFRAFRPLENDPDGAATWHPMRRGVADMHRCAEVSQAANDRYGEALAAIDTSQTIGDWAAELSKGFVKKGKRYRGIKLFVKEETQLLQAVGSGDFLTAGFANRDIAERLYGLTTNDEERLRRSNRISYRLRLLHAHGLIRKIPKRNRYQISSKGRELITALIQLQNTNLQRLKSTPA
ncbi:MAG: winged helix-turn-helix domain-containing protein [Planctomycetaceae bacterium]|nr:winged helix-turn-helix domain-containing protein [Planctomycetaceae bacterium]